MIALNPHIFLQLFHIFKEICMAFAKRVDENQKVIVKSLRDAGAIVHDLSGVGKGIPDLLVGYAGKTALVEIKRNATAKFTIHQIDFNKTWIGGTIARIDNIESAIRLLNVMKGDHGN